jgi:hypothetical protein
MAGRGNPWAVQKLCKLNLRNKAYVMKLQLPVEYYAQETNRHHRLHCLQLLLVSPFLFLHRCLQLPCLFPHRFLLRDYALQHQGDIVISSSFEHNHVKTEKMMNVKKLTCI